MSSLCELFVSNCNKRLVAQCSLLRLLKLSNGFKTYYHFIPCVILRGFIDASHNFFSPIAHMLRIILMLIFTLFLIPHPLPTYSPPSPSLIHPRLRHLKTRRGDINTLRMVPDTDGINKGYADNNILHKRRTRSSRIVALQNSMQTTPGMFWSHIYSHFSVENNIKGMFMMFIFL